MKHYIQSLHKISEKCLAERVLEERVRRAGEEPLETQIHRWWVNLPPLMQRRKFQIVEIAAQCSGRYRERPALRQVAAILRSIGWHEVRDWTSYGRNRRLWLPPNSL